jgi:uncharacterized protein YmfQ (DUF2313 family)
MTQPIGAAPISALEDEKLVPPPPPATGVAPSTPDDITLFGEAVINAFPFGQAWPTNADATLAELAYSLGHATWRIDRRADDLTEIEADPAQTVEMLPDWERNYGLPDPCTPLGATIQQRQAALLFKLRAQGGQSAAYFVAVAAAIGVPITIETFTPFVAGSRAGTPLYGPEYAFVWRVHAPATQIIYFRAGRSAAGEPLRAFGNAELECRLHAIAPAHTILQFAYGS